jgi:hypothetical protein
MRGITRESNAVSLIPTKRATCDLYNGIDYFTLEGSVDFRYELVTESARNDVAYLTLCIEQCALLAQHVALSAKEGKIQACVNCAWYT